MVRADREPEKEKLPERGKAKQEIDREAHISKMAHVLGWYRINPLI